MRNMRSLCQKADVKYFRFHALHHAGASIMERRNVPIGFIQRILGHEKRTTTEIYLHSIGEAEREAMENFSLTNRLTNKFTVMKHFLEYFFMLYWNCSFLLIKFAVHIQKL